MNNNIRKIEQDLRAYAKRTPGLTYTKGTLMTFLIAGMLTLGSPVKVEQTLDKYNKEVTYSIKDMQSSIEWGRKQNKKFLRDANLELIQLMEQGDHVVKSPWNSWQFGANTYVGKWNSTYKGKGGKVEDFVFDRNNGKPYSKYKKNTNSFQYGITDLEIVDEPSAEIVVNASIKPTSIDKEVPVIELPETKAPGEPKLNVKIKSPENIKEPEVNPPVVSVSLPSPNTKPFNDFCFTCGTLNGTNHTDVTKEFNSAVTNDTGYGNGGNHKFWSGYNPNTNIFEQKSGIDNKIVIEASDWGTVKSYEPRTGALLYLNNQGNTYNPSQNKLGGFEAKNFNLYLAGNISDGTNSAGKTNGNKEGVIGVHTVWNGKLTNITGNLYGKANFISIETWHAGNLEFDKVKANVQGNENTIFYIYPTVYGNITGTAYNAYKQRGSFTGTVDADIKSQKNTIYSVMGVSGSFDIDSKGTYRFEGANNLVYSGLGYSPNFEKLKGSGTITDTYKTGLKPSIKLTKAPESYGDGNVIMFFNWNKDLSQITSWNSDGTDQRNAWEKTGVGIYQGEVNAKAKIGEYLNLEQADNKPNSSNIQTDAGNTVGDNGYVENNVGIFARSGQRGGIFPSKDLGATKEVTNKVDFDKDIVHSLQINDIDIQFGKYSRNGVMMVSQNGTVLDVAKISNEHDIVPIMTGDIKDYVGTMGANSVSAIDANNKAATGTIIAVAEGAWDKNNNTGMSADTQTVLGDGLQSSEINIGRNVVLSARSQKTDKEFRPIAYVAKDKGKITVDGTTEAKGFGSIIGYAENGGKITATGKVTAADAWVASDSASQKQTYKNIGGYAKGNGSTVTFTGGAEINGLGALANGTGATVTLDTVSNSIKSGKDGSLVAVNGGEVVFKGGTIENKDLTYEANSHDNVTPFFAKDSGSKIKFEGATTINMYDGILVAGDVNDYEATVTGNKKYQGMNNITVELKKDGVNLGIFKGLSATWDGNSGTYLNTLKTVPKFAAINNPNNYTFNSVLMNGTLTVDTNVDLNSATDGYNFITMERELVTINAGKNVTGNGKGLSMGSNATAASNADSGYINNGNVSVAGGTVATGVAGINVSYGQVHNTSTGNVTVDNGAGIYGTNGSLLKNDGAITVTGSGVGIAGLATGTVAQSYGTDSGKTGKKVEIINTGAVNVAGDNAIAIFADNNKANTPASEVTVENSHQLTVGTGGTGIVLKNSRGKGGEIKVSGTGTADIVTGTGGTGIYGEDVTVDLASNYGIETQDNGVGIYTKGSSKLISTSGGVPTLEYKYSGSSAGSGTAMLSEGSNFENNVNIDLVNSTSTTGGITGILAKGNGILRNKGNINGTSTGGEIGIVAENGNVLNEGNITLGNANDMKKANVGIYVKNSAKKVTNRKNVTVGNNSIGIYGYEISNDSSDVSVGDNGIGVYSQGGNVNLNGGNLNVGNTEAVGILTTGNNQNIISTANINLSNNKSYGFVIKGSGTVLDVHDTDGTELKNNSVFIYSADKTSNVTNRTALKSTGNGNYGLYSSGYTRNLADINFGIGLGNVGIFSVDDGLAENGAPGLVAQPVITAGYSDPVNKMYAIGMAAGYINEQTGNAETTGRIANYGTIKVPQSNGIGMYAAGTGSKADNYGVIELSGENSIGMYLDQGAVGVNHASAEIRTAPNNTKDGIIGVVALNNAIFKNYGKIVINSDEGIGVYYAKNGQYNPGTGTIGVSANAKKTDTSTQDPTGKGVKGVKINAPGGGITVATVERNGKTVTPTYVDTTIISPAATQIKVGDTVINLPEYNAMGNNPSLNMGGGSSELGMYVDTSGINYTNPIEGLQYLKNLRKVNLVFGVEAARYTSSKDIEIGENIINPYNKAITEVSSTSGGKTRWLLNSSSLTWIATATQNKDDSLSKVYLSKIPYTAFAKDTDTYNFMDGLEQRYGVEGNGSREKLLFNKLNDLGKGEGHIFTQAVDQMKGQQYANTQMRLYSTGNMLDKEFNYLRREWDNKSKSSNKIKAFGMKDEYKTDTAGIIDYKSNSYGVAYVHEKEDVRLGDTVGWYAGVIQNRFKFKDLGGSKENVTMLRAGAFKSIPFDYNNSLNVTVSAEGYVARSEMDRRFLIVDEVFGAKSTYNSYGASVKGEVSKEFRTGERTSIRAYGSLKAEYGKFNNIEEKTGEVRLNVKGNDYYSVKPEVGAEFKYKRHVAKKATVTATVSIGYENELGKVADVNNKARVAFTEADWFKMRSEKEDRRGNFKVDFNIGVENQKAGITFNAGYDTKGQNIRGGIGFRVIY